jgi:PAS domain S-box-containing protein
MSEHIQEVFWLTSADRQQLLHISPAFETVWGYPRENLYTYPGGYWALIVDSIHPSDKERVVAAFSQRHQDEYTAEYRIVRSNGKIRWVRSRCFPVQNSYGETWGIAGFSEDITECKQTEELREREKRFRTVFELAPGGIATCNQQGMFLQANQAFQEIFGYTEAELQTLTFRELTHLDDFAISVKLFQELLTGKCPNFSQEQRFFRKDNRLIWGNLSISGIYDANGVFEYAIVMLQDVSEHKQAHLDLQQAHDQLEERLVERTALLKQANTLLLQEIAEHKQAQNALKTQKEFLQTVIDINPHPMFIKDRQDNFLLVNQAFADFYGLTVEDIVGKTNTEFHFNNAEVKKFLREDRTVLETLQPQIDFETRITSPIGAVHYFQIIKKSFLSSDGQAQLVVGVGTDITERKLVEDALRESEQRYRLLIEGMNDGVILVDENGMLSYVNEKLAEMLGYSPSEMIGHHKSEFLDDANLKIVEEQTVRRRRGESGSYELALKKKNGQHLLTIASGTPIQGEDDSFKGSFKVITDITALKTVQTQLQQAKEQLRAVLDAVPGFVSWMTSEGRYLGVNQNLADSFNLSPDAFIGKELGFMKNSPSFVHLMQQFLVSAVQTDRQVIEVQVNDSTRNYLIVTQKYNQDTKAVSVGIDITERKQAEEALKAQKDLLQTVLDTNPNLIWVTDRENKVVLANQAVADFFGLTVEDLLGKTNFDLANLADAEKCIAQDEEVLITLQQKFIPEETFLNSTGERRWFQTIKRPLFSSTGQVYGVLGVSTDITERKQVEEELYLSEARFRLAIDNIPDVFVLYDAQRRFQFVNAEGTKRSKKSLEEHLGYTDEEIWPHEVTDEYLPILKRALETRTIQSRECNIVLPNIGTFSHIVTYVPLVDEQGEIYQILGITHDITARKQVEEQLRQKEEQLRLALEAARIGFWNWNLQTGKVTFSDNHKRLFGLSVDDFDGTNESFLAIVHPEDCEMVRQAGQYAIEVGGRCDLEFRIIWPDESIRWIEGKGQVFYDEAGKPLRITGINVDITERKQAETKIQESLQEKEVLLKEIHHRVKNNLQVISSLLDLQSQYLNNSVMLEVFRESCNRVRSMALVHEQLYQSKDCAKISCVEYFQDLTNYLCRVYGVNANTITLQLEVDKINVNINTAIPCGLIVNELVSNALKYAFPNGLQGVIKVAFYSLGRGQFLLIVKDNGIGFSRDWNFNRVKSLGLQLVRVLTNQLEGTLEINNNGGTEFRIKFSDTGL